MSTTAQSSAPVVGIVSNVGHSTLANKMQDLVNDFIEKQKVSGGAKLPNYCKGIKLVYSKWEGLHTYPICTYWEPTQSKMVIDVSDLFATAILQDPFLILGYVVQIMEVLSKNALPLVQDWSETKTLPGSHHSSINNTLHKLFTNVNDFLLEKQVGESKHWSFGDKNVLPTVGTAAGITISKGFVRPMYYGLVKDVVSQGQHVQFFGPRGVGKSAVVEHLAEESKKYLYNLNCDAKIGRIHLEGRMELTDGTTKFVRSPFADAVIKGDWAKLDELNMAEPDAIITLNGIIAPPFIINVNNEQFPVHPDFRLFVTYNPGYTGTKHLPESLEDRMFPIQVGYPTVDVCAAMLKANKLKPEVAQRLAIFANLVWEGYKAKQHRFDLSIRRLISAGLMLQSEPRPYSWNESIGFAINNLIKSPADYQVISKMANSSSVKA